jgi:hypothetical protein
MHRTWSIFLVLFLLLCGLSLFAQEGAYQEEDPDETFPETGFDEIMTAEYSQGDKNFIVSLGTVIPLFFSGIDTNQHGISVGAFGSFIYNYFLTPRIFIGGELSGMFAGTRSGNMLYIVPFGLRAGYQFSYQRFEFPVSLMIGAAAQKYLEKDYLGLIVKPVASVFWRFNPEWSFGMNSAWWFVPQWPENGNNAFGNFLELTLSARYQL